MDGTKELRSPIVLGDYWICKWMVEWSSVVMISFWWYNWHGIITSDHRSFIVLTLNTCIIHHLRHNWAISCIFCHFFMLRLDLKNLPLIHGYTSLQALTKEVRKSERQHDLVIAVSLWLYLNFVIVLLHIVGPNKIKFLFWWESLMC